MIEGREGDPVSMVKGTLKEEDNELLEGSRSLKKQGSRGGGLK